MEGLGERGFAGLNGSATPPMRTSESTVSHAHSVVPNNWKVSLTPNWETKSVLDTQGQSANLAREPDERSSLLRANP